MKIAVIGSGTMGAGIAQVLATHHEVIVRDIAPEALENAKKKLDKKNLDFIVLNDVSKKDIGFNSEYNKVTVISKDNILEIDKDTKLNIADKILDLIK